MANASRFNKHKNKQNKQKWPNLGQKFFCVRFCLCACVRYAFSDIFAKVKSDRRFQKYSKFTLAKMSQNRIDDKERIIMQQTCEDSGDSDMTTKIMSNTT